ncbi:MAG: hypothetical protein BWK77_05820 [Verrucomicrobia bacterium A1]|nr:MAG: hypothetical protein BWK77_05820 [Verrucomicrobia bacterium A1]
MSTQRAPTGIGFFDDRYGGVYAGRSWLVCGPSGAGKSAVGLQFLVQGVKQGERCLLLSAQPAADVAIWAASFGPEIERSIESGEFVVLEYNDYVPGRDKETDLTLPPEGFLQLQEIIDTNAIKRVVLDTALPWVMTRTADMMAEHVFSFVRAFDRLRCTTMLTMPRPVSPVATRLKNALDEVVPVSVMLSIDSALSQRSWLTTKFLGEARLDPATPYLVIPGHGAVAGRETPPAPEPVPLPVQDAPPSTTPAPREVHPGKVRFSSVVLGNENNAARAPNRSFRFGMTITK